MPTYIVQGKLGTGKGKYVMGKIRDALQQGRRVATNCDLWLDKMLPEQSRMSAVRVPDKPTAFDLDSIGHGNPDDSYNEDRAGVMVLDELGSWLNSRSFQDQQRAGILDWLIHARKKGWDVYLVVQNAEMIDKQVRIGLAEYLVKCIRADKIKIPLVGQFMGGKGKLPRFHIAQTSMSDVPGVNIDREFYRNDDLQDAYDTLQIFRDWARNPTSEGFRTEKYMGPFSYLSPWHTCGRFKGEVLRRSFMQRLFGTPVREAPKLRPKLPLVAKIARLNPDRAWHFTRTLVRQGVL